MKQKMSVIEYAKIQCSIMEVKGCQVKKKVRRLTKGTLVLNDRVDF